MAETFILKSKEAVDLHPVEKSLFAIVWADGKEEIEKIEKNGYEPKEYWIMNTKTGKTKSYFALSPNRALALAYMDQGWEVPFKLETQTNKEPK